MRLKLDLDGEDDDVTTAADVVATKEEKVEPKKMDPETPARSSPPLTPIFEEKPAMVTSAAVTAPSSAFSLANYMPPPPHAAASRTFLPQDGVGSQPPLQDGVLAGRPPFRPDAPPMFSALPPMYAAAHAAANGFAAFQMPPPAFLPTFQQSVSAPKEEPDSSDAESTDSESD